MLLLTCGTERIRTLTMHLLFGKMFFTETVFASFRTRSQWGLHSAKMNSDGGETRCIVLYTITMSIPLPSILIGGRLFLYEL